MTTRIGIYGYGNIGRGVQVALEHNPDIELVAVFTRRNPADVDAAGTPVYAASDVADFVDKIDVMILCGGSANDLPEQTPELARLFTVVDSFDNHSRIPEHFAAVDKVARETNHTAVISMGWDPGLFSLARLVGNIALPSGQDYTFWGTGVSQGHSDAVRRVEGVKNAKQYTVPVPAALEAVRAGENPELTTREKHTRVVYVVAHEGADTEQITRDIVTMPAYFADYDTTVHFIDEETFNREHSKMAHGGFVLRSGETHQGEHKHLVEFSLKLDSNPEFTSSVLVAYARAAHRLASEQNFGAKTIFDIPLAYAYAGTAENLRAHML